MKRLAALAAVVLLVASACGGSGTTHGGSGLVTAGGSVGSLKIDVSTPDDIRAFAGTPDAAVTGKSAFCCSPSYRALGYDCQKAGGNTNNVGACQTVYYVNSRTRRLAAFKTASPRFHAADGIRPGMGQNAADRLAHQTPQGPWDALYLSSRSDIFILTSSCGRVTAGRCSGKVIAFMLESYHHGIGLTAT